MDPFDELTADHREVLGQLDRVRAGELDPGAPEVAEVARALAVHAAAEELVVYPAARAAVSSGGHLGDQHLHEHELVKQLLLGLERTDDRADRSLLLGALGAYVRHHAVHEESVLFPQLRESLTDEQRSDMGDALQKAKAIAPTHPHPHAPNTPPMNVAAGLGASLVDRVRDRLADARSG